MTTAERIQAVRSALAGLTVEQRMQDVRDFVAGRPMEATRREAARRYVLELADADAKTRKAEQPARCVYCWSPSPEVDLDGRCPECAREAAQDAKVDAEIDRQREGRES